MTMIWAIEKLVSNDTCVKSWTGILCECNRKRVDLVQREWRGPYWDRVRTKDGGGGGGETRYQNVPYRYVDWLHAHGSEGEKENEVNKKEEWYYSTVFKKSIEQSNMINFWLCMCLIWCIPSAENVSRAQLQTKAVPTTLLSFQRADTFNVGLETVHNILFKRVASERMFKIRTRNCYLGKECVSDYKIVSQSDSVRILGSRPRYVRGSLFLFGYRR